MRSVTGVSPVELHRLVLSRFCASKLNAENTEKTLALNQSGYILRIMNELALAKELMNEAQQMIAERDKKRKDANVYRNVIRHGHGNQLRVNAMNRLNADAAALQEEIDFKVAFAENIIERLAA